MQEISLHIRWENQVKHRYYLITVKKDLLGDLILTKAWGSKVTQLGNIAHQVCTLNEILPLLKLIHQQRLKHGYQLTQQQGVTLQE